MGSVAIFCAYETSENTDVFEDDMVDGQLAIFTEETEENMALLE